MIKLGVVKSVCPGALMSLYIIVNSPNYGHFELVHRPLSFIWRVSFIWVVGLYHLQVVL